MTRELMSRRLVEGLLSSVCAIREGLVDSLMLGWFGGTTCADILLA